MAIFREIKGQYSCCTLVDNLWYVGQMCEAMSITHMPKALKSGCHERIELLSSSISYLIHGWDAANVLFISAHGCTMNSFLLVISWGFFCDIIFLGMFVYMSDTYLSAFAFHISQLPQRQSHPTRCDDSIKVRSNQFKTAMELTSWNAHILVINCLAPPSRKTSL